MDITPDSVYVVLKELGTEATLGEIERPTHEFYMRVINHIFSLFHINIDEIMKISPDQKHCLGLTGEENADIVHLLNLKNALNLIGSKIFLKEFYITDLTDPLPKKTRGALKLMCNFALYATKTKAFIDEKINGILRIGKEIEEKRKQTQKNLEQCNLEACEIAELKKKIEQMQLKNRELASQVQSQSAVSHDFSAKFKALERNKQNLQQVHLKKQEEYKKHLDKNNQLKNQIVGDPESVRKNLEELKQMQKKQENTRKDTEESIHSKKSRLNMLEQVTEYIKQNISPQLPKLIEQRDSVKKEQEEDIKCQKIIEELTKAINALREEIDELKKKKDSEVADEKAMEAEFKKSLSINQNKKAQLLSLNSELKKKSDEMKSHLLTLNEKKNQKDENITQLEEIINKFLAECTKLCNEDTENLRQLYDNSE